MLVQRCQAREDPLNRQPALEQHSDVVLACSGLRLRHRQQVRRVGPLMF
jgi:hypothetical protein